MSMEWLTKLSEGDPLILALLIALILVLTPFIASIASLRYSKRNGSAFEEERQRTHETIKVLVKTLSDNDRQHNDRTTTIIQPLVQVVESLKTLPDVFSSMQQCQYETTIAIKTITSEILTMRESIATMPKLESSMKTIQERLGTINQDVNTMTSKHEDMETNLSAKLDTIITALAEINQAQPAHIETTGTIVNQLTTIQQSINRLIDLVSTKSPRLDDTTPTGG